ncbi:hypothetical protein Pla22_16690 [Rubripirellula amarantea]|uniref:Uncharacterized protein n=1 Tax=Rubripirellula amarantea TaxID=2527999 RepID=A0A5C5WSY2_9BACT|nr:hypothetical protein Pla22_16690 [Rubripirellula amarantea]
MPARDALVSFTCHNEEALLIAIFQSLDQRLRK